MRIPSCNRTVSSLKVNSPYYALFSDHSVFYLKSAHYSMKYADLFCFILPIFLFFSTNTVRGWPWCPFPKVSGHCKSSVSVIDERKITHIWFYFNFNSMFKSKFLTSKMTNLLQYVFGNTTFKLNAISNSCMNIASFSSQLQFTFIYANKSIENSSEQFVSCKHICTVNFVLRRKQKRKMKSS